MEFPWILVFDIGISKGWPTILQNGMGYSRKKEESRTWYVQRYWRKSMWNSRGQVEKKCSRKTMYDYVEFPWVLVFDIGISNGCLTILQIRDSRHAVLKKRAYGNTRGQSISRWISKCIQEKPMKFPWVLVFELGISKGCHNFAEFLVVKACFLENF